MLFTSLKFALFVLLAVICYYAAPKKWRIYILFLTNFAFYLPFGKRRLACMLLSAVSVWLSAIIIDNINEKESLSLKSIAQTASKEEKTKLKRHYKHLRQVFLYLCVLANFSLLALFKFYPLAAKSWDKLPHINLLVPVGISFYTLQVVGYIIDVYNKRVHAEKNPFKMVLFTMYFPQIIEGPISRFDQLSVQLFTLHSFDYDSFVLALEKIIWGYFKKLVIADRLFVAVNTIFTGYEKYSGVEIFIGAVLYTIQLYADFSGGIDIAVGVSELFGVKLAQNFNSPFFSKSIPEFWRRWHITLGTWLRDYVFYPVTFSKPLNKLGKFLNKNVSKWAGKWVPAYISLLVLWLCNGLWHGEGMQYIAFGLYHGLIVIISMSFEPFFNKACIRLSIDRTSASWRVFSTLRTFALVVYGELIFRSESLDMAFKMTQKMFEQFNPWVLANGFIYELGLNEREVFIAFTAIILLFVVEYFSQKTDMRLWVKNRELPIRWAILFAGIIGVAVYGAYGPVFKEAPFIYFQF